MTFLTILGVTEILCSFWLVLERETGKEIPKSSRLEFREKFLGNNFALSDAENNTSGPLNWGDITDLPLLRILLVIRLESQERSFWKKMDCRLHHIKKTGVWCFTCLNTIIRFLDVSLMTLLKLFSHVMASDV